MTRTERNLHMGSPTKDTPTGTLTYSEAYALAQKEGLETRVATSEYSGKEYQYSRTYLDDGTEYSISATDHGDFFWVLITIVNSQDNTIPRKMCERIRSLAFERGLTLSRNKLSDKIVGGDLVVSDMLNGVVISIEHD